MEGGGGAPRCLGWISGLRVGSCMGIERLSQERGQLRLAIRLLGDPRTAQFCLRAKALLR